MKDDFILHRKKVRKQDQELLNAAYFGNLREVKKWVALGGNVNFMEERDGWMPIHYAARWGNLPMVQFLMESGAELDGKTNSKETALHKCSRWNRKEVAMYLMKLGANPYIKNSDGLLASEMTNLDEMKHILNQTLQDSHDVGLGLVPPM